MLCFKNNECRINFEKKNAKEINKGVLRERLSSRRI
jgi:hypothetical protein